jgi:ElaB/YqjD/DUF883 family membrane-anchored ribosome-binding protein
MNPNQSDGPKDRLFAEFNTVVAEAEQLLRSVANAGSDKAGAFKTSVEERLAAAGDRMAKIREESMNQASAAVRATDDYVQENPWRAVGIVAALAALTGLAAGLLIARSRSPGEA